MIKKMMSSGTFILSLKTSMFYLSNCVVFIAPPLTDDSPSAESLVWFVFPEIICNTNIVTRSFWW